MSEYKKNQLLSLEITDISTEGQGIGHYNNYTVFVKGALVGDVIEAKLVKVKKNYGFGIISKIIIPSKNRVAPKCKVASPCGGCQLQSLNYKAQLDFKANKVINNLKRIGNIENPKVDEIIGMEEPYRYRNKAQYPIGLNKNLEIISGFFAGRTHSIIEVEDCLLGQDINNKILFALKKYMKDNKASPYNEKDHSGLVRHCLIRQGFHTKEIMVCIVVNGKKLPNENRLVEEITKIPNIASISINVNTEKNNVILGKELRTIYGNETITDYIGDIKFNISPLSFFQVNPTQTEKLYNKALEYANLSGNEVVWDLYCGIGSISLFLAQKAKEVYGVEIIPQAIENAKENAKLNNIANATFFCGKAEEILPQKHKNEGVKSDVIVVDPPRKGCDIELLNTIININPKRLVYVSCDSATLARDVKYLCENGFKFEKVTVVDQFPQTVHVESVVLLSKGSTR